MTTMSEGPRLRLARRDPDLAGLRVLVVGLGKSGRAALRLLARRGARLSANDRRDEAALGSAAAEARALGARLELGGHPAELAERADLVVLSPGVPPTVEAVLEARRLGRPVWGETELGARFCRGRVVAITGSNGKSTVTAMTGTILRAAGLPGATGGNLDTPLCDMLAEDGPGAVHALELSSFQIETLESLEPEVAVVLNLSPDHLDRYPSFEAYAAAKAHLLALQRPEHAAVLNADDPPLERLVAPAARARVHRFSASGAPDAAAIVRERALWLHTEGGAEERLLGVEELPVPGEHNLANALAAALACRLVGVGADAVRRGLGAFRALPHRLQHVATVAGVEYYDDSKATNPASAVRGLGAFPAGRVQLILGGRDKGADWSELLDLLPGRASRVLLVGEAAAEIERLIAGRVDSVHCETIPRAVAVAATAARPGDVVLLSPGCASFDQYSDFTARGRDFQRAVERLGAWAGEGGRDA